MFDKIKKLEIKINEASIAYYNDESIISDDEYDALIYELSLLDSDNDVLKKVGSNPMTTEWKKEKHLYSLGSLNKVNYPEEMSKWINNTLQNKEVVVSEKLDGLSIGCQYENGKLVKAILRGAGIEGEDIFNNVIKMKGVVRDCLDFTGVLRGEIILTKSNHKKYFPEKANPRNAASGICRRLDGKGVEHLTILFYQVFGKDFNFEIDQFNYLRDVGCFTPNYKLCKTDKKVNEFWQDYQDFTRDNLDYEIDGLVIACNDIDYQNSLGETNLRSKGKLAFKFANQFIETTVKDIEWVVGNSGRITPLCWFEPVKLLGSTIQKASIYNLNYINQLNIDVGAKILVCKANEVIPRVEKVIQSTGTVIQPPIVCPSCGELVVMIGEHLTCPNTLECSAQIVGRLSNWIKDLNILEWGDSLIERLVESGKVETPADLYTLTVDDLMGLERMGKKSAEKCYKLLWEGNEVSLDVFLGGLSIPMIGSSTIRQIMDEGCDTLEKFGQLTATQFEMVPGVGPTKAKLLEEGLKTYQDIIRELIDNGVKIKANIIGKLTNQSICFTGKSNLKRSELQKMAINAGAKIKSVGKDLTFLVIADPNSSSSKAQKARKLGITLISEEEFISLIS